MKDIEMNEAHQAPDPTPQIIHGFARLLAGIETSDVDNGTPEPWRSIGRAMAGLRLEARLACLCKHVEALPGVDTDRLIIQVTECDPTQPPDADTQDRAGDGAALLPIAPAFPVDCLPRVMQDFVRESTASLVCPADFIAVPLLTAAGAAIGTTCRLRIKDGWYEWPLLYTLVVGPSGSKKTPAKDMALKFTLAAGREFEQQHATTLKNYERQMDKYHEAKDGRRRRGKAEESEAPPDKPVRPVLTRSWVNDCTMEAIGLRLKENPRGMLLARDELAGLVRGLNQYRGGRGSDLQNFMSLWNCDPIMIDRKGEPDPVVLNQPFLAITGGIQPGMLAKVFGGDRLYDGFTARFLVTHPESVRSDTSDATVSDATKTATSQLFGALFKLSHHNPYAQVPEPQPVSLDAEARDLFRNWERRIGTQIDSLGEEDPFRAVLSKMPGQLGRLALILHVVRWAPQNPPQFPQLGESAMRNAISLAEYFIAHARKVWSELTETQDDSLIRRMLSWMRAQRRPVTKREIQRSGVGGLKSAVQVEAMMRHLVDCELVGEQTMGKATYYTARIPNGA